MSSYQDFALEMASQTPAFRLRIKGTSMLPLLMDGESVIIQPVPHESLRCGDIIAFRLGQETITHRIVALAPQQIRTLGDNLRQPDSPIAPDAVLGRMISLEKNGHSTHFAHGSWPLLNRLFGWWGRQMIFPDRPRWISRLFRVGFWLTRSFARSFFL